MNLWSHRFSQNTNKVLSRFLPSLHRTEILTIFRSYFGRNNDFINSFWNCMTVNSVSKVLRPTGCRFRSKISSTHFFFLFDFHWPSYWPSIFLRTKCLSMSIIKNVLLFKDFFSDGSWCLTINLRFLCFLTIHVQISESQIKKYWP